VRFSVWHESGEVARAEAAVSLDEAEAARLARFLVEGQAAGAPPPVEEQPTAGL
jgi:hypothetical protein